MKVVRHYDEELNVLQGHLRQRVVPGQVMQILEAGCGREWYFDMQGIEYVLTGIDLDADALEARQTEKRDLHVALVGDLRTVDLEPGKYDVIYNAFVLEHVKGAETVLRKFVEALKPGGILVLRIPDPRGAHGFLARATPHWVHVLYYRYAWGLKDAGKPGFAPYRTVYDKVVSQRGLREFAQRQGLVIRDEIGVGSYERGNGVFRVFSPIVARVLSIVTFGYIHANYVDLSFVLEKPCG